MKRLFIASIFCLITASLSAQFTLTDSLVAYYPFNGNADDESGNGHNGTIHGPSTTLDRFGNANSAYQFDGVDDYIESSTKIPITDFPVTVSVFIKIGSDIKGGTVYRSDYWDGYTDDTKGIGVSVENPGHVIGYFGTGNSTITFQSEYRIASRNWQHIAVVFENTDSVRIYFNGKESPWIKTNKSDKPFTTSGTLDKIGKDDDGLNRSVYEGAIDELRIYNRVLSSTEINDICSEDGFDPVDGEPVAYYPFNGNANDESGNGHDGTAYGPTLVPNRFGSQLSAYAFDGVNDSIILNRGNPIDVSGPMTIACWAKTDTTTNNHLPLISDYSSENGFYIYFTGDRTGPATWMASSNFQYYSDTDEKYDDGEWHHWAFTVAGIGQSDIYDAKLYIDAELSSTQFTESSIPVLLQNLGTIGAAGSTYFFKGVLDDIRIFNFELSEQEIQRVLFLDPKPHVDSIPPIFINVTTGILDSGDDVNVTISEEGVVYLVPSGTDPQLSNLRQAAKDSAKVLPYVEVILATDTILNGASLVVYAVDTKGNISEPSPVIAVRPIPRYDLAMVWISPDNPDCGTTREQAITVQISNSGPDTAPGYEVSYSIDNGENFITELINLPIASGQTREYQFIEKADMLADTSFSCISTVFVPDDIRTSNDTSIKQVHNNRIQIITETDSSVCKQKTGQANILTTLGGQPPYYYLWNKDSRNTAEACICQHVSLFNEL
ncbi:MAG TPA: LamG domain-containing protein, partial [Bacteroides sp.]|nr:LamG domain-containing protein [Bacteroides sp.]